LDAGRLKSIDDWPRIQQRYEAWWQGEMVDRVLIAITAPKYSRPEEQVLPDELRDWWTNPERVIARGEAGIAATYYCGDAFPVLHPSTMVAITASFLGAPLRLIDERSSWCDASIDDWDARARLDYDPDNELWLTTKRLLAAAAERAVGNYYVGVPDLNGPGEVLARLRGSEPLAIDLIENQEHVLRAMSEVNQAWYRYWQASHGIVQQHVGGYVFWMGAWSELPAADLQVDFSCMISPEMFDQFFLPFVEEQTRWVPRTIYHLDGPGAIRHLDSLLCLERMPAIQWVPGAGAPPQSAWLPLLRRIQARGKRLHLSCSPYEVPILLQELEPQGLCLMVHCESPEEADRVLLDATRLSARRQWVVHGTRMH